jgi:signal transduction histidine kinase
MAALNQAFALIISLPGSAIYHIMMFFALQAAFGIAWSHRRRLGAASGSARLVIAAGLAALARVVLLALVAAGSLGFYSAEALLPPLDRAVTLLSTLLIAWAVLFRPGRRWADVLVSLAVVAVAVMYAALAIQWYPAGASGVAYNRYDTWWELAKMGVILFTILGLFIFRPPDWGTAFGLFLILYAGVLIQFVGADSAALKDVLANGSFSPSERIAEMAAFPLFAVLVYRHSIAVLSGPAESKTLAAPAAPITLAPSSKVKLTPQAASALTYIAVGAEDDSDFSARVSEAVGRTLLADYTLLFAPPMGNETLSCINAFDLIREAHMPGFSIAARKVPTITSAMSRGRPARLRWDTHEQELSNLVQSLGIPQHGSAVFVPFAEEDSSQNLGGILVMAAFSQKEWSNDDHNLLASIAKPLAKAIVSFSAKSKSTYDLLAQVDAANHREETALADVQNAQARAAGLADELERLRDENRQHLIQIESLTAIIQADSAGRPAFADNSPAVESAKSQDQADIDPEEFASLQDSYRRALEDLAQLNEELTAAQEGLKQAPHSAVLESAQPPAAPAALGADAALVESLTTELTARKNSLEQLQLQLAAMQDNHAEEVAAFAARLTAAQQLADQHPAAAGAGPEASAIQDKLTQAQAEIERLKAALVAAPAGLAPGLGSVDDLTKQLSDAHSEIVNLRRQLQTAPVDAPAVLRSQSAMLLSLIQDMRQPLSSMVGYTDLLLGESVGIIGALQRNFLERVKASGERMTHTLDDLIRLSAIDSGTLMLEEQDFEIVDVIEDAFTGVGTQFREKSISLRMDIAEELPPIAADRDAITQIISRLLTNACSASEPNSEVVLMAHVQGASAMLVSVRDTGGGIPEKDMPRVFARSYRADRPLIQGLGETGVGLSIAKALAEAQGGRIWVDSQIGSGSTFSVLLPTNGHQ